MAACLLGRPRSSSGPCRGALADVLYEQAQRAELSGRWQEALSAYEEAYRLRPNPRLLFRIARACAEVGKRDRGIEAIDQYRAQVTPDITEPGESLEEARLLQDRLLRLPAAEVARVNVNKVESPASVPIRKLAHGPERTRLFAPLSYAGYGISALLLAGAIAAHVVREQQVALYNDDARCLIALRTREDSCAGELFAGRTAEGLAIAGYVLSGALLAGSTAMLLVSRRERSRKALACAPALRPGGPGGLGFTCQLTLSFP